MTHHLLLFGELNSNLISKSKIYEFHTLREKTTKCQTEEWIIFTYFLKMIVELSCDASLALTWRAEFKSDLEI